MSDASRKRPRRGSRPTARERSAGMVQPAVALGLVALFIGVPLWLVLVTSFKTQGEAQQPNLALPTIWQPWTNYAQAFADGKILLGLANSLLVVVPSTLLILVLGAMASWIFARRGDRLAAIGYAIVIVGLLLPPAVVTLVLELRWLGIANTHAGLIATYTSMYLPIAVFLMTGFVRLLPRELEEAARIDGAGPIRIFLLIILPLLGPVIATATIMVVLFTWSDVFYASFVLGGGSRATLPLNLLQVASAKLYQNNWHLVFAYIVMMSAPMIAIYAYAQRRIISGVTGGALK